MTKRPLLVTIISCLYILAGTVGVVYHAGELLDPKDNDLYWVLVLRLSVIVGGIFTLRGANWARWLLLAWIAYHVGLSTFHSLSETLAHTLLFILTLYSLFNSRAKVYFSARRRAGKL